MDLTRIKQLRRSLTLHFAVIAVLTAALVATGSGSIFLPAFMLLVTTFAYIFVDRLEWLEIGRIGSYFGMAIATTVAIGSYAYSVANESESGQLLAIAGLLVYPEAVLFLQRKNQRIYEQLAVFLLLEMIVAALVNDNILFGVLLTPIMVLWVSSLFLFSRYASLVHMDPTIETPIPKMAEILFKRFVKSVIGESEKAPVVTALSAPKLNVQSSKAIRRSMQSFPIGIGAIVFAGLFFYLVPRTSPGDFQASFGDTSATGLPSKLTFGRFGKLLQNKTPVMRISIKHAYPVAGESDNYQVESPPYLRSLVVDRYAFSPSQRFHSRGQWDFAKTPVFRQFKRLQLNAQLTKFNRDAVLVEFDIDRKFVSSMFSVPPVFYSGKELPVDLRYDPVHKIFQKMDESNYLPSGKSLVYEIGSVAFQDGVQVKITPARIIESRSYSANVLRERLEEIDRLRGGASRFPLIDRFRLDLIERKRLDESDNLAFATALEDFFVYSGEFNYSLDVKPPADQDIDLIEDFLINNKVGHCQYFASAMVLLLRQQGIPSRIVIGYRPKEYNNLGQYFHVRQNDAHAWVEGLFSREELMGTEFEPWLSNSSHYWMRFDPTPGFDGEEVAIVEQQGQAMDYAEKLWKDYVVEGQKLSGENSIYEPVTGNGENAYGDLVARFEAIRARIRSTNFTSLGFLGTALISLFVLALLLLAGWQLLVFLPSISPALAKRIGSLRGNSQVQHDFYAQALSLIERLGLKRDASETPLEYTEQAGLKLKSSGRNLESGLGFLTWMYYKLQFGKAGTPSPDETQRIEAELLKLKDAVATSKK